MTHRVRFDPTINETYSYRVDAPANVLVSPAHNPYESQATRDAHECTCPYCAAHTTVAPQLQYIKHAAHHFLDECLFHMCNVREEFDDLCATMALHEPTQDDATHYRAWLMAYNTLRECARQTSGRQGTLSAVYLATIAFRVHYGYDAPTVNTRKLRNTLTWMYTHKLKPDWSAEWV